MCDSHSHIMKTFLVLAALVLACQAQSETDCVSNNASFVPSCLTQVTAALKAKNLAFLPAMTGGSGWTPSRRVDVTFTSSAIDFQSCCNSYSYKVNSKMINPLDFSKANSSLMPVNQRTAPSIGVDAASTFPTNKTFMLMMVDADVPTASVGTAAKPLVHWLAVNIKGQLSSGDEVLPYVAPAPTDNAPHSYYFLLYEQSNIPVNVTALNMTKYAGNCSTELMNRCLFEVKQFAADNNAVLQGVTWFQSLNDPYTNYRKIQQGGAKATYCSGVTGYSDPCQTGGTTVLTGSMFTSLLLVLLVGVFV